MPDARLSASPDGRPLRAIVLGVNGHPRAVACVRSLGRAGIGVVGVRGVSVTQSCHSRYLRETHVVDPKEEDLLPFLESLGQDGGGVLFPVYDQYLITVSRNAESLSKRFTLTIPPWEILSRVMDHALLYEIAQTHGIRTPTFFKPRDASDLERILSSLDLANEEYLLKTIPGVGPAEVASGRATKVAGKDVATVRANCREIFGRLGEYPLIAAVVPGEANQCFGVTMLVDRNSEPLLCYCTQRLKLQLYSKGGFIHPYELGSNVYCESVHDSECIAVAKRLVKALGYYGLVTFEFRRDPRDQSLILIKADPRVVRPTSLSTALGMDTPTALYRQAVGAKVDAVDSYPEGVAWLWETTLLETLWHNRDVLPLRRELMAIGRRFGRIKAFAYFDLRDPLPFIVHAQWRLRVWTLGRIRGLLRRCTRALGRDGTHPANSPAQG